MSAPLVLVPRSLPAPELPGSAMLVHFATAFDAVVSLRATDAPAVIVTDGLPWSLCLPGAIAAWLQSPAND